MDTSTPEQRRRTMQAVRSKNTGPELVVRRLLYGMDYRYWLQLQGLPGKPDIAFMKITSAWSKAKEVFSAIDAVQSRDRCCRGASGCFRMKKTGTGPVRICIRRTVSVWRIFRDRSPLGRDLDGTVRGRVGHQATLRCRVGFRLCGRREAAGFRVRRGGQRGASAGVAAFRLSGAEHVHAAGDAEASVADRGPAARAFLDLTISLTQQRGSA